MSYTKNGIKFPRCTDIISDATNSSAPLIQWGANCVVEWSRQHCKKEEITGTTTLPQCFSVYEEDLNNARFHFREVSKTALDIGSEVHNAIEKHLQGKDYVLTTKEAERAFRAFLDWKKDVGLRPIKLEQTVWGDRWAGTIDYLGFYKNKLYVIDWKTSKAFYPEMRYQVAAYRSVSEPTFLHKGLIKGCGILRLDKETGMPEFKDTSKSYEKDLKIFNCMLDLYFERHPRIAKRFEEI